ncbi:hypothetical protein [Stieleria varia]|nr:hypothetical protein [Stieleria varia]
MAAISIAFAIGYYPRASAVALFVLYLSLHCRCPFTINGGDSVLRLLFFWAIFLPLDGTQRLSKLASGAFLMQLFLIYFSNGMTKSGTAWTTDFTAVRDSLLLEHITSPFGSWLSKQSTLTTALTVATLAIERIGAFLIFVPVCRGNLRRILVLVFWSFHIGIGLTLSLWNFSIVMCIAWIPLIPDNSWGTLFCVQPLSFADDSKHITLLQRCILVVSMLLVVGGNIRTIWLPDRYPAEISRLELILGLGQRWKMFAPSPMISDRWIILAAKLDNDSEIDLWTNNTVILEKPHNLRTHMKNRY